MYIALVAQVVHSKGHLSAETQEQFGEIRRFRLRPVQNGIDHSVTKAHTIQ